MSFDGSWKDKSIDHWTHGKVRDVVDMKALWARAQFTSSKLDVETAHRQVAAYLASDIEVAPLEHSALAD